MHGPDTIAVLAGGLATRMRPLTEKRPKALLEVAGEPFIHHQLRLFARNGLRRAVLLTGYLGEMVAESVGNGEQFGIAVDFISDGAVLQGTGGALRNALPQLPELFFVTYGDSYLDVDYAAIGASFSADEFAALMTLYRNANRHDRSNADLRGNLALYQKLEPPVEWAFIDFGLLVMTAKSFSALGDAPSDLADLLSHLSAQRRLQGLEVTQRFYEVGSPAGLAETNAHLATTTVPHG